MTMPTNEIASRPLTLKCRPLCRRDLDEVLAMEPVSFERPWSEQEFLERLRRRNCIALAAEETNPVTGDLIRGYLVYSLYQSHYEIVRLAVEPYSRRLGVATALLMAILTKTHGGSRRRVLARVSEWDTPAQLLLRSAGFRAEIVLRNHWKCGEDAYGFAYEPPKL